MPERIEEPVAALAVPAHPHLADQHDRLGLGVRSPHVDVVFDHAPAPGLVPRDADRPDVNAAVSTGQSREPLLELSLRHARVHRELKRGHRAVAGNAERIDHRDAHRSASPTTPLHTASNRSTCGASAKRSAARCRAAAPNRLANSGSPRSRSSIAASWSASPGDVRNPVTPSSMSSGTPPTAVAIAGTPQA